MGPSQIPPSHAQAQGRPPAFPGQANKPQQRFAPTPAISYTPTDVNIPVKLYEKVPDLDLYKKLQDAEKQLDILIARKGMDFQSIQASSLQPLTSQKETGTLRIFVFNTCENMPWQKTLGSSTGDESSWTLRIEGNYSSDTKDSAPVKFSSLLSGVSVEILPNSDYPNLQGHPSNNIEWRDPNTDGYSVANRPNPVADDPKNLFDGIDIKRQGIFNINCKIAILIKDPSARFRLSTKMAHFTGKRSATQQELVYIIWQYILFKNLFKKSSNFTNVPAISASSVAQASLNTQGENENDFSLIESDETLKDLLNVGTFTFSSLYKLIHPHLLPPEPIVIDYEVDTTRSTTLGDVVIDVPIEFPMSLRKFQREAMEESKRIFENMSKTDDQIQFLNLRISLGITALQSVNSREIFFREFSKDPVNFIRSWLESQSETLKALKSEEGYNEEIVRRAQFFQDHEEELKQKIDLMLGAQKL